MNKFKILLIFLINLKRMSRKKAVSKIQKKDKPYEADSHVTTCHATLCHALPRHAMPRYAMPPYAMPRYDMPPYATPRYATPRYATLCHATLCHATLSKTLPQAVIKFFFYELKMAKEKEPKGKNQSRFLERKEKN